MKLRYFWNEATGAGYLLTDEGVYAYSSNSQNTFDGDTSMDKMVVGLMMALGNVFDKDGCDTKLLELHGITTADCIEVDSHCQPLEG